MKVKLGIIADDFTGASDVASFLSETGANCILLNGIPETNVMFDEEIDVVVIALKSRSIPADEAVSISKRAAELLIETIGVEKLYFKYCSTFDSTSKGNIGPVTDMLLNFTSKDYTILVPSLPVNGRTVRDGILYVNKIALSESHMRHHPINPMKDSNIRNLMDNQSQYPTFSFSIPEINHYLSNKRDFEEYLNNKKKVHEHFYLVIDYYDENHGKMIADLFYDLRLHTGGSAFPPHLYKKMTASDTKRNNTIKTHSNKNDPVAILSGSLSNVTHKQIEYFKKEGYPFIILNTHKLLEDYAKYASSLKEFIDKNKHTNFLIGSQREEKSENVINTDLSITLERLFTDLSEYCISVGIKNIVVAGGETSGAVVNQLNHNHFYVGNSISPGVPILMPTDNKELNLVLKSGNFGEEDFFSKSTKILQRGTD